VLRAPLSQSGTGLVERVRDLGRDRLAGAPGATAVALGLSFVLAAVASWKVLPHERPLHLATAAVFVVAYVLVDQVRFEVGSVYAVPTQLVIVPMALLLPARVLPVVAAIAVLSSALPELVRGQLPLSRFPVVLASAWYMVGPALVLGLTGDAGPELSRMPVYLGALAAQGLLCLVSTALWARAAYGVGFRAHAHEWFLSFAIDAALSPIGLAFAVLGAQSVVATLGSLPLVALLAFFGRVWKQNTDKAIELSHAYRGTAMLLGDVIEADDEYTGNHSRDVVELVVAVSERMKLSEADRRDAEFTALLHDVGKVKIPSEIINKPGPLDDDERAVMKLHTVEGERMLEQVGGMLGRVGRLVRSCHEHYDGSGYPDALAGEDIPLVARIVCCCDAFNAMTTDRSYRKALPLDDAVAELRRCSGTQFDPAVVEALVAVVG
jgi:HD-GYP domain-containing protein (c-di-GMP phosphodiesterase class II)